MPLDPSLITGGAQIATGLIGDAMNFYSQSQANKINQQNNQFNQQLASKQFAEQQYLNRNANQIAVADMAKAGLNPMAGSASSGMSAGSAGASATPLQAPQVAGYTLSAVSQLASQMHSSEEGDRNRHSQENISEAGYQNAKDIAYMQDNTKKLELELTSALYKAQIDNLKSNTGKTTKETEELLPAQIESTKASAENSRANARSTNIQSDYEDKVGVPIAGQGTYTKEALGASSAISHAFSDTDAWAKSRLSNMYDWIDSNIDRFVDADRGIAELKKAGFTPNSLQEALLKRKWNSMKKKKAKQK